MAENDELPFTRSGFRKAVSAAKEKGTPDFVKDKEGNRVCVDDVVTVSANPNSKVITAGCTVSKILSSEQIQVTHPQWKQPHSAYSSCILKKDE